MHFSTALRFALGPALLLGLASCETVKRLTPDIHVPMPSMPDMTKVLPFQGDKASADDPEVPFSTRTPLGYGHTLRLEVYEGSRNVKELHKGLVMVDRDGVMSFGKLGSAKVGGRNLDEAARMIASVFRVAGRAAAQITVHIVSVENVNLVRVEGDVRSPQYLPMWDGMKWRDVVNYAGGRSTGSAGRAVYVTREGLKRFQSTIEVADDQLPPRAGDILTLSADL